MKTISLTGLTLALLVFTACQAHAPASASTPLAAEETIAEPSPGIVVYTVDGQPVHTDRDRHDAVVAALQTPVSFEAKAMSLREALAHLREATALNIAVNWPALELVSIEPDNTLDLSLDNVTAEQTLEHILEQASFDAFDDDKAGYTIRGGMLHISTLRELNGKTESRLYPLNWYANTRPTLNKQIYGRNKDARRMLGMTTLQNQNVDPAEIKVEDLNPGFCANCDAKHDRLEVALQVMTYWEKVEQVIELITTTVGNPDEWLDEDSTLTELNGALHIKTTPENHDHIRRLFESMRLERARRFKQQALEMETLLLLESAEMYRLKQDYRAALKKINEALRVDLNSLEARALKEIVSATLSR